MFLRGNVARGESGVPVLSGLHGDDDMSAGGVHEHLMDLVALLLRDRNGFNGRTVPIQAQTQHMAVGQRNDHLRVRHLLRHQSEPYPTQHKCDARQR